MRDPAEDSTNPSLLYQLRKKPGDPAAWQAFVEQYGPKLLVWCQQWGLQDSDARDVTQDVLVKLVRRLAHFEYDPKQSFRAWLKTVARNAWKDLITDRARAIQGSGDTAQLDRLGTVEAREDLIERLSEEFDRELFERAVARVRRRVEPHVWSAFHLLAVERWDSASAAQHLDMKVTTLLKARRRVQQMLQEEVNRLNRAHDDEAT
jgi:RNA polymerase sigma-70 factor (ECF subfamily)